LNVLNLNRNNKEIRLQVYLARGGVASRRASEELIARGRVQVNGVTVAAPGQKVFPGDIVLLDGVPVKQESRLLYLALNKPPLYICSSHDPQGRPLALDLLPGDIPERLYSVGRLDFRSSGLIIFTNDGGFAAKVGHPGAEIEKEYLIEASGPVPDSIIEDFSRGLEIEGEKYRAKEIERTGRKSLRIVLIEGKNREIRRVFSHFHLHPVLLRRIRIGPVLLGKLGEGKTRSLEAREIERLGTGSGG
jgi:23S rRNA pseudouridine2605 synthase